LDAAITSQHRRLSAALIIFSPSHANVLIAIGESQRSRGAAGVAAHFISFR
jgi:hypothetical protein